MKKFGRCERPQNYNRPLDTDIHINILMKAGVRWRMLCSFQQRKIDIVKAADVGYILQNYSCIYSTSCLGYQFEERRRGRSGR